MIPCHLLVLSLSVLLMGGPLSGLQTPNRIVVKNALGEIKGSSEPRSRRPQSLVSGHAELNVFFQRHDVRDEKGRIVSGLGFISWTEGSGVRVAVLTLVPKPGAPNTYLAEKPEQVSGLQLQAFAEFSLAVGQSRQLDELKRLGVELMSVTLVSGGEP